MLSLLRPGKRPSAEVFARVEATELGAECNPALRMAHKGELRRFAVGLAVVARVVVRLRLSVSYIDKSCCAKWPLESAAHLKVPQLSSKCTNVCSQSVENETGTLRVFWGQPCRHRTHDASTSSII